MNAMSEFLFDEQDKVKRLELNNPADIAGGIERGASDLELTSSELWMNFSDTLC